MDQLNDRVLNLKLASDRGIAANRDYKVRLGLCLNSTNIYQYLIIVICSYLFRVQTTAGIDGIVLPNRRISAGLKTFLSTPPTQQDNQLVF